ASHALQLNGLTTITITSALEEDLLHFTNLCWFNMFDENKSSPDINFSLMSHPRVLAVLYLTADDMYILTSSPPKTGYLTPPTPTTVLSSCGSSSNDSASPPSSTLSLYRSMLGLGL
ncbi:hypothetical protein FRC11_012017, partial [Ceratobasidium sp. 423]